MMAIGAGVATEKIIDLFRQDTGYATPRVDVRGAAFRDGRVLMVRERNDGRWALPGGWADVNQTAGQCVAREIEEESGFSARAVKLRAVWDRRRHGHTPPHPFYVYKIFSCARSPEVSRARASKPAKSSSSPKTNCPTYPPAGSSRLRSGACSSIGAIRDYRPISIRVHRI
jgi:ADP-ribose pyrophosphatase YjhB (NUDIX family)